MTNSNQVTNWIKKFNNIIVQQIGRQETVLIEQNIVNGNGYETRLLSFLYMFLFSLALTVHKTQL